MLSIPSIFKRASGRGAPRVPARRRHADRWAPERPDPHGSGSGVRPLRSGGRAGPPARDAGDADDPRARAAEGGRHE
jgi:hypothetical protein